MRSCICANGCSRSTRSFQNEIGNCEVRCHRAAVRRGCGLRGHAVVELDPAGCDRLASDHVLAGGGLTYSEQDPVWIWISWWSAASLAASHDGAMGANDSRRAREVPRRNARSLRRVWNSNGRVQGLNQALYAA